MAINLSKGQKIDLTKTNPGLSKITVGLGWDTNKYDGGKDFDLDVSVFLTNASGKVDKETNFIFSITSKMKMLLLFIPAITVQVKAMVMMSRFKWIFRTSLLM